MKLIIGGARGTNPVSQSNFMKYGGETTSFLIEGRSGERILVDAGTGVRQLGHRLESARNTSSVLLLMTHYHLDHVIGLPSLSIIYSGRWSIRTAAPRRERFSVERVMSQIMAKPFWPLQVSDLASHVHFANLKGSSSRSPLRYGRLEIRWCPVHHPGGSTAYRIDEPATGGSCVVATDIEWARSSRTEKKALLELCAKPAPPRLLLFDGHYTPAEYVNYRGWGHSTWQEAVEVARKAGAHRLLITHHAPSRDDRQLARIDKQVQRLESRARLAREGMEVELGQRPARARKR